MILYPDRMKQLIDFEGLRYGDKGAPTDIDGLIEYKNKGYIIIELKHNSKGMPDGQRWAIERMVKDFKNAGKISIGIVAEHDVDVQYAIPCRDCIVREYYLSTSKNIQWRKTISCVTVGKMIDEFIELYL